MVLTGAVPTPSPAGQQQIAQARSQRQALQDELDRTVAGYNRAQAQLARTQASIKANQIALEEAAAAAEAARHNLSERADAMYRQSAAGIFSFLFDSASIGDLGRRVALVAAASGRDSKSLEQAEITRSETARLEAELERRSTQEQQLLSEMSAQTMSLTASFSRAQTLETTLVSDREAELKQQRDKAAEDARRAEEHAREQTRAEDEKRAAAETALKESPSPSSSAKPAPSAKPTASAAATAPSPSASPEGAGFAVATAGMKCPVDGPVSFTDTYGHPRSGGRRHQGVDMFAAMGTPTVAIVDGTVQRKASSAAGGLSLYFKGIDGVEYFYAHLQKYAGVENGQKLSAGQVLGYVGDSGNAAGGPPHLHLEVAPAGSGPINPTPTARRACG
ncbi:MAG: murein hydrolase activator EnvC family protein [Actinomycetota bacterium]